MGTLRKKPPEINKFLTNRRNKMANKKLSLGENIMADDMVEENRDLKEENQELLARIEALTREANAPLVHAPKADVRPLFAKVRIILEENEGIAPSGQYFGLHGNWVNPETLEALEEKVQAKEMTRKEAVLAATENIQFEAYLRSGEEADVPVELLSLLNDAVQDVAIIDPLTSQVLGYKSRLRYPYRIIQQKRA
jgi:hypothetical protein